jgi:hypothetical protein
MTTKHTPGPWAKRDLEILGPYKSNAYICDLSSFAFMGIDEAEANATLIASAPELLDAAKDIKDRIKGLRDCLPLKDTAENHATLVDMVLVLAKAIAKAEGKV